MAFSYYSPVTVQSGQVPSTQTDFPMLVSYTDARLKTVGNGGHVQNANGYDIRPYSDSGLTSALTFELEYYNASTGQVIMWVKVGSLADGSIVYLGYGDSGISTDGSSSSTWDSNFKGVWHLGNGTSLSAADATSNGNNGTLFNTPTAGSGQIDGAASFASASSQYIEVADSTSLHMSAALTISFWANITTATGDRAGVFKGQSYPGATDWYVWIYTGGNIEFDVKIGAGSPTPLSVAAFGASAWHKYDCVYNGTNQIIYKDGSSAASQALSGTIGQNSGVLRFAQFASSSYFNGLLDQIEISGTARSANWITTSYNNQSASSTFATLGTEVPVGGSSTIFRRPERSRSGSR